LQSAHGLRDLHVASAAFDLAKRIQLVVCLLDLGAEDLEVTCSSERGRDKRAERGRGEVLSARTVLLPTGGSCNLQGIPCSE
jgi:hypothetical protein